MSLHTLANHLQSAGRGEDKVLVHMTPGEVNGLQSLAMAHGGSLTINPDTGLPEAGILKSLLPMIAGFALGPAGLGMTAMQAGLTTAAVGAAATGSLGKGLMIGMGAYSGAGLGAGLQSMAAPAAAPAVPGLSPTVAANASTLGGTSPLANVATGTDDILASTDELMGIKPNYYDPRASSVFVKNAPVPAVTPANAADFMNQTNQSVLGKLGYTGSGSLPVAGAKSAPFSADFPSGNSVVHTVDPSLAPRPDTYFTPRDSSGVIRGASGQAGKPITTIPDTGEAYSGSYSGVGDDVLIQSNRPVLDIARTSPLDEALVDSNVASYDKSIMSRGPFRADYPTVTASKDLVSASPIDEGSQYFADINSKIRTSPAVSELARSGRTEIIVDPTMTEHASITQYTRPFTDRMAELGRGAKASFGSLEGLKGLYAASEAAAPYGAYAGLGSTAYSMYDEKRQRMEDEMRARAAANQGLIRPYTFSYGTGNVSSQPYYGSAERTYFQPTYTELPSYKAPGPEYAAKGGLMSLAVGGPVEEMAAMNAVGANTGYPMAALQTPLYANPAMQRPEATNVIAPSADAGVTTYSGEQRFRSGGTTEPQSSGYSYDYNPNTMQFTQTGGPGVSNAPRGGILFGGTLLGPETFALTQGQYNQALANKPAGMQPSIALGPESFALTQGQYQAALADKNAQQSLTSNNSFNGGMASLSQQPAAPAQSFIPNINIPAYQTPEQQLGLGGFYDYMNQQMGGYGGYAAGGGVSHLGGYSDGGRLLKGPGDGVSDSIPASIGNRQPARLADGEFVVPARIVSEIGNGSTDAGARKLYAMMDRIQKARSKTVGKRQVAKDTKAENLLPA